MSKKSNAPPTTFDSARYPLSERLAAFSDFSLQSPKGILNGIVLSPISQDTPNIHRVRRQIGEGVFTATVQTTGYGITYNRGAQQPSAAGRVSLCLVREGYGEIETRKERRRLNPGDVYVSTTSDNRFIVGPGIATRILMAEQPDGMPLNLSKEIIVHRAATPMGRLLATAIRVAEDSLALESERERNSPLDQIISDIVGRVLATHKASEPDRDTVDLKDRARSFIIENIANTNISPQQIAEFLGMSRAALYRSFKDEGGVASFVTRVRVEVARSLLGARENSGNAVQQVAALCGFKSQSHFSQAFKRHFGMTPSSHKPEFGVGPDRDDMDQD